MEVLIAFAFSVLMLIKMKVYPRSAILMWYDVECGQVHVDDVICMGRVRLMTKLNQNVNLSVCVLLLLWLDMIACRREINFCKMCCVMCVHLPSGHENVCDGKVSNLMFYCCFVSRSCIKNILCKSKPFSVIYGWHFLELVSRNIRIIHSTN